MGVSGMNGVQFFDRLALCFMPVKHHPSISYVKKVKTWRMVMFTMFQGLGLVILWVVKSSPAALAFPFFVVAMIPYRMFLKFVFTDCELDAVSLSSSMSLGHSYSHYFSLMEPRLGRMLKTPLMNLISSRLPMTAQSPQPRGCLCTGRIC